MSAEHYFSVSPETGEHEYHHLGEIREESQNPVIRFGKKLRSLDGVDEVAQALGQILPGLAGPIATLSVLGLATPFVFLGLLGMKEEYMEAREEYDQILQSKKSTKEKLVEMSTNAEKWRIFLSKKLNLGIKEKASVSKESLNKLNFNEKDIDKFAHYIVEFEAFRNEEFAARIEKKYGWTGMVGMGGMFVGMIPAVLSAGIGIAEKAGTASEAAISVAGVLTDISGGAFLAGQVAMSAYAANKVRKGKAIEKHLLSDKKSFEKHADGNVSAKTKKAVSEIIDRKLHYNKKGNIQYGIATDIGQAFMAAATISALSGAGVVVSAPLVAIGAPITLGAAAARIIYNHKEENFLGHDSDYSKNRAKKTDLLSLLLDDRGKAANVLDNEFEYSSHQLAQAKLYSIMRHLINDKKYKKYSPERKLERLEKIVSSGRLSFRRRTGLRGDVVERVGEIFREQRASIEAFIRLPQDEANCILLANTVNCVCENSSGARSFDENLAVDKNSLMAIMKSLGFEGKALYNKAINDNLSEDEYKELNELLISKLKSSLKFVRLDVADKLVHLSYIGKLRDIIKEENVGLRPESFEAKINLERGFLGSRSVKPDLRPISYGSDSKGNYGNPKKDLDYSYNKDSYEEVKKDNKYSPEEIKKIKQNAEEKKLYFVFTKTYINENGDTVYLYEDTRFPGKQLEHGVTYIKDKDTKELSVKYGPKTRALVIFDSEQNNNDSAVVLKIKDAKHKFYGNGNYPKLDHGRTGLHDTDLLVRKNSYLNYSNTNERNLYSYVIR